MTSNETLRWKYLGDEDSDRLYENFQHIGRDSDSYCPTCRKRSGVECDCQLQLQLQKHYTASGIGDLYQRYTWDDLVAPSAQKMKATCSTYLEHADNFVLNGIGVMFLGSFGSGKSLSANLLLKELMWRNYSVYATTFASLVSMFTDGWKDQADKKHFYKKIKRSQILLIDELGREFKTSNNLSESIFDDVIRTRIQSSQPTFITSNMSRKEIGQGYGGSILSLLAESALVVETFGSEVEDYRTHSGERRIQEVAQGIVRKIV